MCRPTRIAFVCSLCLAIAGLLPTGAAAQQLLNPGFEAPDASGGDAPCSAGWECFNDAYTAADSAPARTGNQVLKVFGPFFGPGAGAGATQIAQASLNEVGRAWVGEVYAMNWSGDPLQGNDYGRINIEFLDAFFNPVAGGVVGVDIFPSNSITAATAQDIWTPLRATSGPAPAGTAYVQVRLFKVAVDGFNGGSVFWDDVSLRPMPDPVNSVVVSQGGFPFTCPAGDVSTGTPWVIKLRDGAGAPIVGYPADLIEMTLVGAAHCAPAIADAPTDSSGVTAISSTPAVAGLTATTTVQITLDGADWFTETLVFDGFGADHTASSDVSGDGRVDLCDLSLFVEDLGSDAPRSDLVRDGSVNATDASPLYDHRCHSCVPESAPFPGGEIGIYFDPAGTIASAQVAPGEVVLYVVARGIPGGIRALSMDLELPTPSILLDQVLLEPGFKFVAEGATRDVAYYGCVLADAPVALWRVELYLLDELPPATEIRIVGGGQFSCSNLPIYQSCANGCDLFTFATVTPAVANPTASAVGGNPGLPSKLHGSTPNPFNALTSIRFDVAGPGPVTLAVYDVMGRRVRSLVEAETYVAGPGAVDWDGRDDAGRILPSGSYFYRLETGGIVETKPVTLLK